MQFSRTDHVLNELCREWLARPLGIREALLAVSMGECQNISGILIAMIAAVIVGSNALNF